MDPIIPLSKPWIDEREVQAVRDVLKDGWLTQGPRTQLFEAAMQGYLGGQATAVGLPPFCVGVSSATAGLHLAVEALSNGQPSRVLVPTWTFTASAHAVELAGGTPVFCDVNPFTLNMDAECLYQASKREKHFDLVMPVHMTGRPVDLLDLRHVLPWNPPHIEDCAHAIGSSYLPSKPGDFQLVGNPVYSPACVFSFYASKGITTGEGGMVIVRDRHVAARLRQLRYHGLSADAHDRHTGRDLAYTVTGKGYKYNMNDIAAAIGIVQLQKLPDMVTQRRAIAQIYFDELHGLPIGLPVPPFEGHSWHLFIATLPMEIDRQHFIAHMNARGIVCGIHYEPLHRTPYWRDKYGLDPRNFPGAESVADRVVTLPLYAGMSLHFVSRVVDAVKSYFPRRPPRRPGDTSGVRDKETLH